MSTEIEPYQPSPSGPSTAMERAADFATWAPKLQAASAIAREICQTDFVPGPLRGKPAAVTAAILAGSEMNIGPMASLMHVHMIDGRPSLSAEMQRALVLALGHHIRYREMSTTRCVVDGQRRGETEWTTVTWTMDDARAAGLNGKQNWRRYPRRMLAARATGELCRLLFSDALSGMPFTSEELEDEADDVAAGTAAEAQEPPKRRTAQRRTATRKSAEPKQEPAASAAEQTTPAVPEPPLPGEDGYDDIGTTAEPVDAEVVDGEEMVTRSQLTKLHTVLTQLGYGRDDRDEKLRVASVIVARPLATSQELTKAEAHTLIDTLEYAASSDDPKGNLAALIERAEAAAEAAEEAAEAGQDGGEE